MTVKELRDMLSDYNDNDTIMIKCENFAYSIYEEVQTRELRSAWGIDRDVLVLIADDQIGRI